MTALETRGLSKRFGGTLALDTINLHLAPQQRLLVLGQSGAGKTTLLRVLAGLEAADHGSILIDGHDVTACHPNQRGLALVSQDYALYPQLNVRQNLETALSSLKLERSERDARIQDALSWFHLAELQQRRPSQLSGGQSQRLALAKAIVRRPRLLLLDEPLSQVDCVLREELRQLISLMLDRYATSLVMVTHDPLDAMRLASHIAIMESGRIVQFGPPSDVYQTPACRAAADLLSPFGMNWLVFDHLPPKSATELEQLLAQPLAGKTVGFRPEDALFPNPNEPPNPADMWRLPAKLQLLQSLGFADLALLECGPQQIKCLGRGLQPSNGREVAIARRHLFVF